MRKLDGSTSQLLIQTIRREGEIDAGNYPLRDGFRFQPMERGRAVGRTLHMALGATPDLEGPQPALVGRDVLERFAGIPDEAAALTPRDRLLATLLRYHEGELDAAAQLLPLEPLPQDDLPDLRVELLRRIGMSVEQSNLERMQREEEARRLIRLIFRQGAHAGEAETTVREIEKVLSEYGDLEYVKDRSEELRTLRNRLLSPQKEATAEDFRDAFGATTVDLVGPKVTMTFDFDAAYEGRWSRGDWLADLDGWFARGVSSLDQVLQDRTWPRLVLRAPLDLQAAMEVEVLIEQPAESGPPRLLVLSVAGVHLALVGAEEGESGRVLVAAGGPDELERMIREAVESDEGEEFEGLVRGRRHRVRVELSHDRGRADVFVDEERVAQLTAPRPEGRPGTASIVVRSFEPVRLLSARIQARKR